ncbi:MAG TPA: 30S ribosomal protein S2 [Planctomycetota bacterium]|nr:30S ribosomal protein S2 [Planctomycetota bacterium]
MLTVPVKDLLEAGCHFGCRASRWNPRMKPFIFGRRNQIHIIDLKETLRGLIKGATFLQRLVAEGQQVLFVGTKRQAQSVVAEQARRVNMPYVSERWLGGTLTNFTTIRTRLQRLNELEETERSGRAGAMSKKALAQFNREKRKIFRNLDGLRLMEKLPGALVVIDPKREHNAVKEASKLGIPIVSILDTDCDPSLIDVSIPANDDSMRSIHLLLGKLADAVAAGSTAYAQWIQEEEKRRDEDERRKTETSKKRADEKAAADRADRDRMDKIKEAARRYRAGQSEIVGGADQKPPEAKPAL